VTGSDTSTPVRIDKFGALVIVLCVRPTMHDIWEKSLVYGDAMPPITGTMCLFGALHCLFIRKLSTCIDDQ